MFAVTGRDLERSLQWLLLPIAETWVVEDDGEIVAFVSLLDGARSSGSRCSARTTEPLGSTRPAVSPRSVLSITTRPGWKW